MEAIFHKQMTRKKHKQKIEIINLQTNETPQERPKNTYFYIILFTV